MRPEKFQVDKIRNGRLSAILYLDTPDIAEYHEKRSRSLHHYYEQIVRFQERMHLEKFQVDKFKMAAYRPLFTSTGLILRYIMKTAQDSYTITIKQIVRFQERMHFDKFQLHQVQNGRQLAITHFHMAVSW